MKGFIMVRHRLTDEQWDLIADLFSPRKRTGRPPRDRRQVIDGILWVLNTGSPWRDLPEELGPWATAWDLFDTWNHDGTLAAVLRRLQGQVQIDEELWCIDGTVVRAHKCAAGGGKKGTPTSRATTRSAAAVAV
ncbi:MAG: IS5 family transposase [Planctomycetota bacterium]